MALGPTPLARSRQFSFAPTPEQAPVPKSRPARIIGGIDHSESSDGLSSGTWRVQLELTMEEQTINREGAGPSDQYG
jgi:hypothetical protein